MRKVLPLLLILVAVILAACGGQTTATKWSPTSTRPSAAAATTEPTIPPAPTVTPLPNGCETVSLLPEPDPVFPDVNATDWVLGSEKARITILEYSDFQCPYCAQAAPVMEKIVKNFPGEVRFVFRHFPLNIHDKSIISAQAAEAAGLQGKFWEMHDLLFAKQATWSTLAATDFVTWVTAEAKGLGLDEAKFTTDLNSAPVVDKVQLALQYAETVGLDYTPFVVLNGRVFGGEPTEEILTEVVKVYQSIYTTIEPIASKACPPQTINASKKYTATVTTSKGDFTIQLYAKEAPLAVNSFVYLVNRGWFEGIPFHRVIPDFVAQTGDPSGTGMGNPGYAFNNEIVSSLKFDKEGVVGMANAGANTNGSQIFITYSAQPHLDGQYTIFGQVTSGMDVLKSLTERDVEIGVPTDVVPDKILKVVIKEE